MAASVIVAWADEAPTNVGQFVGAVVVVVIALWLMWRIFAVSTRVSPDHLEVRGVLRRRRHSWDEVAGLDWETPRWMKVVFFRYGGSRVRVQLESGESFAPLSLYGSIDYTKIERAVGAARRNLQLHGKRA